MATIMPDERAPIIRGFIDSGGSVAVVGLVYIFLAFVQQAWGAANAITTFVSSPDTAASTGAMSDARDQLTRLLRQATPRGSRFVVFVDDLERCRPPRPIEVLEVINQFLCGADVVTVLIADLPAVAACADIKYAALARASYNPDAEQQPREKTSHQLSYGWLYLQKIVQLRFDLPSYKREHMEKLLESFEVHPEPKPKDEPAADVLVKDPPATEPPSNADATISIQPPTPRSAPVVAPWERAFAAPWPNNTGLTQRLRELMDGRPWQQRAILWPIWLLCLPAVALARFVESAAYPPQRRSAVSFKRSYEPGTERLRALLSIFATAAVAAIISLRSDSISRFLVVTAIGIVVAGFIALIGGIAVSRCRDDRRLVASVRSNPNGDMFGEIFEAERRYLALDDDSEMLRSARIEALKYVAPLPRTSKRLLNDLRLMLYIASHRKMFEVNAGIAPVHFGKWAALRERWPQIARLVVARPALMANLENPAAAEKDHSNVDVDVAFDPELSTFLTTAPRLGPVIDRIVRYESTGGLM